MLSVKALRALRMQHRLVHCDKSKNIADEARLWPTSFAPFSVTRSEVASRWLRNCMQQGRPQAWIPQPPSLLILQDSLPATKAMADGCTEAMHMVHPTLPRVISCSHPAACPCPSPRAFTQLPHSKQSKNTAGGSGTAAETEVETETETH